MTDINGTVVGIQGFAVNNIAPSDGYVLTWSAADGYWVPRPAPQTYTGLRKEYFTTSTTWVCPVGVTSILVIGAGGGGGGKGGTIEGGVGGGGVLQQVSYVTVVPGTTYTITIGNGGAGSSGVNSGNAPNSSNGESTTLKDGSIIIFSCRGASGSLGVGNNFAESNISTESYNPNTQAASGGRNDQSGMPLDGNPNYLDMYIAGTKGSSNPGGPWGGGGGGAGPQGNGGNGGAYNLSGTASNGANAAANSGAGGGGGGGAGSGFTGGNGGNGGSGYMYIVY